MATGSIEAKPIGGSTSPLDEHGEFLLGLTVEQPDMTLDEIVAAMARAGIAGSRTAVWRFYERHDISFKKKACTRRSKSAQKRLVNVGVGCDSKACLTRPGWCSSTKPARIPVWCAYTGAARAVSG